MTAARVEHARVCLTYEIPERFGGLTQAMLKRTVEMTRRRAEPCLVLTVGPQSDLAAIRADLHERGLLVDPSHLRNLWEDLEDDDWFDRLTLDPHEPEPELDPDRDVVTRRSDGSLLAVQRWVRLGSRTQVGPLGDAVSDTWLWRSDGTYAGHVSGTWSLWRAWLGRIVEESPADRVEVIVDSATVADGIAGLPAPKARLAVVLHNNHLRIGGTPPVAPLNRWRAHLLERADQFDALIFLTEQQRRDAEILLGPMPQAHVVPNIGPAPVRRPARRETKRGLMLAALTPRKRVDHAIRAVSASTAGVRLTVHGEGERRDSLQRLIDETSAPVELPGYTDDPRGALERSSFLVLTSSGEGLPMVLLEAAATGCIPVAYDIAYGPREVIDHRVDGLLVDPADEDTLARELAWLASRPRWKLARMRRAAVRKARGFTADAVTGRWNQVFDDAGGRRVAEVDDASERHAMITRFLAPELVGRIAGASHGPSGRVELLLELDVSLHGHPEAIADPLTDVTFTLIDRISGRHTVVPHVKTAGCWSVTVEVDDLQHSSLHLSARVRGVRADGLVMGTTSARSWQSFAPERDGRGVLMIDPDLGLTSAQASPVATATVSANPAGLRVAVDADGRDADQLRLTKGSRTETLEPDARSTFVVPDTLPVGRWSVHALIDDTWRLVALAGSTDVPATDLTRPTHVDLTPKGYLRIVAGRGSVEVDDLTSTGEGWTLTGTATAPATLLIGSSRHEVAAGSWSVDVGVESVGAVRAQGVDVIASSRLAASWPVTAQARDGSLVLHRSGPHAEPTLSAVAQDDPIA